MGAGAFRPLARAAAPDATALTQVFDAQAPGWLAHSGAPGAAIALVQGGQVVWVQGYGLADREAGRAVTPETVFGVASISKPATAWGVMKLVEAGKVDLDAPIERYLTRWRLPAGAFDSQAVTVRRLLSHTAGISPTEYKGYTDAAHLPTLEQSLSGQDGGVFIQRSPGSGFAYSDGGYLLLQLMVEEVSGRPFTAYMQQEVLDPLGLPLATFDDGLARQRPLSAGYDEWGRRLPAFWFVEKAPAGLYMTAGELAAFVAAAMPGLSASPQARPPGRGVLRPETLAQMFTPQARLDGYDRFIYAQGYGLGYFTETVSGGPLAVSHMGGNLGGMSEFAAFPAEGAGIVILTNTTAGQEFFATALAAWTEWLGRGNLTVGQTIRVASQVIAGLAGALSGAGLYLATAALTQRRSRRRWLALPALLALAAYWAWGYPFFQISMPGQSIPMLVGVTLLCLAVGLWGAAPLTPR